MAFQGCHVVRSSLVALGVLGASTAFPENAAAQVHLRHAPPVKEVLAKVKGSDPIDTAARQFGAFRQLSWVVMEMCEGGEFANRCTPAETAIMEKYTRAAQQADAKGFAITRSGGTRSGPDAAAPKWARTRMQYDRESYRMELLELWPQLRAVYQPVLAARQVRRGARQQREQARAPAAEPDAATSSDTASSGEPAAPATGPLPPPDPAVARARKANIDTTVFGLRLGEAVKLPGCPSNDAIDLDEQQKGGRTTCIIQRGKDLLEQLAAPDAKTDDGRDLLDIRLARDRCPEWLHAASFCGVHGIARNRILDRVVIFTGAMHRQDNIVRDLKKKYGRSPKRTGSGKCVNVFGGGSPEFHVYEWFMPGVHAKYEPLRSDCRGGKLLIETDSSYEFVKNSLKEKEESQPKL